MRPLNVFPAAVRVADREWNPARVVQYGHRVTVWALVGRTPTLVAVLDRAALADPAGEDRQTVFAGRRRPVVAVSEGVVIARAAGCGCSHPLKRWRPPATLPPYDTAVVVDL